MFITTKRQNSPTGDAATWFKSLRQIALVFALGSLIAACGDGSGNSAAGGGTGGGTGGGGAGDGTVTVKIGNGTGVGFVENEAKADTTDLQSGASTTISVNFVDENNAAITDEISVTFSSDCVSNALASFDSSVATTAAGLASAVYTALGCAGTDIITVTATVNEVNLAATVTLTIAEDQVLAVEFESVASPQLSLAGIGGEETTVVTFQLVGAQSAPIIGEEVTFSTSTTVGGITLADGTTSDISDSAGLVSTVLQSGTVAGSVNVIAQHVATGIQGISEDITISTGVPVANRFSLAASEFNPLGAFNTNGIPVEFSVILSDQFGNDAPDGTRISFITPESGNIDSSCILVSGECTVTWISASPRPADNRVTILAYTSGAEDFDDLNGNNVFDLDDNFSLATQDLGEAFADENENGVYDIGEAFIDSNTDLTRNEGNLEWNGPCLDGINPIAECPGAESVTIFRNFVIAMPTNVSAIFDLGGFPAVGGTLTSAGASGLLLSDSVGNSLPNATAVGFAVINDANGGLSIAGPASFIIPENTTLPNGPFSIFFDVEPGITGTATLELTVAIPNETPQTYRWAVTY